MNTGEQGNNNGNNNFHDDDDDDDDNGDYESHENGNENENEEGIQDDHQQNKDASSQIKTGRWTEDEHKLFLMGLNKFGKAWGRIADLVKTRNSVQIRTHAQKYFFKLQKKGSPIPLEGPKKKTFLPISNDDDKIAKKQRLTSSSQSANTNYDDDKNEFDHAKDTQPEVVSLALSTQYQSGYSNPSSNSQTPQNLNLSEDNEAPCSPAYLKNRKINSNLNNYKSYQNKFGSNMDPRSIHLHDQRSSSPSLPTNHMYNPNQTDTMNMYNNINNGNNEQNIPIKYSYDEQETKNETDQPHIQLLRSTPSLSSIINSLPQIIHGLDIPKPTLYFASVREIEVIAQRKINGTEETELSNNTQFNTNIKSPLSSSSSVSPIKQMIHKNPNASEIIRHAAISIFYLQTPEEYFYLGRSAFEAGWFSLSFLSCDLGLQMSLIGHTNDLFRSWGIKIAELIGKLFGNISYLLYQKKYEPPNFQNCTSMKLEYFFEKSGLDRHIIEWVSLIQNEIWLRTRFANVFEACGFVRILLDFYYSNIFNILNSDLKLKDDYLIEPNLNYDANILLPKSSASNTTTKTMSTFYDKPKNVSSSSSSSSTTTSSSYIHNPNYFHLDVNIHQNWKIFINDFAFKIIRISKTLSGNLYLPHSQIEQEAEWTTQLIQNFIEQEQAYYIKYSNSFNDYNMMMQINQKPNEYDEQNLYEFYNKKKLVDPHLISMPYYNDINNNANNNNNNNSHSNNNTNLMYNKSSFIKTQPFSYEGETNDDESDDINTNNNRYHNISNHERENKKYNELKNDYYYYYQQQPNQYHHQHHHHQQQQQQHQQPYLQPHHHHRPPHHHHSQIYPQPAPHHYNIYNTNENRRNFINDQYMNNNNNNNSNFKDEQYQNQMIHDKNLNNKNNN